MFYSHKQQWIKLTQSLTCSINLDFAFSGEADFLDEVGRLLAVEDCLPEERPDPVREVAESKTN